MLNDVLIEKFREFQEKSGKHSGLNLQEVTFDKIPLSDEKYFEINPKKTEIDKALINANIEVSFIPLKNIDPVKGICDLSTTKPIKELIDSYTYFAEGDVIFTKVTPSMENGNIAIAENLKNNLGFGSSEYYVFRSHKILNKLLWYYMRQRAFKDLAKKTMRGAGGLKRVPKDFFDTVYISVPQDLNTQYTSMKIQEALVEFLDYKKNQTEQLRDKMSALQSKVDRTNKAILNKIFEMQDPFIVDQFNRWAALKSYTINADDIEFEIQRIHSDDPAETVCIKRMGFTPMREPAGDINWFTVADLNAVESIYIDQPDTKEKTTMPLIRQAVDKNNTGNSEKLIPIKKGDILISFKLTVGVVKIYNSDLPGYCNEAIDILTVKDGFHNEYIAYNCMLEYPKYGTQTNNGMTLNDESKKEINIYIPKPTNDYSSYELQKIIVEFIWAFNLWKNKIMNLSSSVQNKCNKLDDAFLAEIFKGSKND